MRGYFGIGIENMKTGHNLGTLWRSAYLFHAAFIFVIGHRYKLQCSDTYKTCRHIPLYQYDNFEHFYKSIPYDCQLIGVELVPDAYDILIYSHPQRCIYLLGSEDNGLTSSAISKCHRIIQLPGDRSMNVSTAGSIVMYDRYFKSHMGQ